MKVLLRAVAVLFVLVAAVRVYAVIHAAASAGGARPAVAIAYIIGAIVLAVAASRLWRRPAVATRPPA